MYSQLQNVPKNQLFKLYFSGVNSTSGSQYRMAINEGTSTIKISKDGGLINSAVNSAVYLGTDGTGNSAMYYVILTAEEMNADVITVNISWSANIAFGQSINIYTGDVTITAQEVWEYVNRAITGGGTTVQSPAVMTSIAKAVNKGYIVSRIATGESGYNYYGLTNVKNPWWLIIQEKTDFSNVGYKMAKENRLSFNSSWTNRATLNYGEQFPLK